jgi:hypothetical protein
VILSIDPGVTTGIAILHEDGEVFETTTVATREEISNYLYLITQKSDEDFGVVVEEGPQQSSNYRSHIQGIEEEIKRFFSEITWVQPAQWKNHPAAVISGLGKRTQHEKDAVGLGRWYRKVILASNTT